MNQDFLVVLPSFIVTFKLYVFMVVNKMIIPLKNSSTFFLLTIADLHVVPGPSYK